MNVPPIPAATPPVIAGRFELVSLAGHGGMGSVYQAIDQFTGARVALKLLHKQPDSGQGAARFLREAQVLAQLNHRSIVACLAHGTAAEQAFLAMEWLEGEDLASRLRRGPLPLGETLAMAQAIAEALELAHAHEIVHRDVKPGNIFLVAGTGGVKLLDFGVAHWAATHSLTRAGAVIGTLEYMAPEQAQGVGPPGAVADIYSLGCVLYECLAGEPPFVGEHPAAVLFHLLYDPLVPLAVRRPELPPELLALVGRMLDKEPARRPTHVSGMLQNLQVGAPPGALSVSAAAPQAPPAALTYGEARLVSAVLVCPATPLRPLDGAPLPRWLQLVPGARATWLATGWLLVVLERLGVADDLLPAARLATQLQHTWPGSQVALAVGRRAAQEALTIDSLVQTCGQVLRRAHENGGGDLRGVYLDEPSANLLDACFTVERSPAGYRLGDERDLLAVPPLLGSQPRPCVGRDTELRTLELQASGCFAERRAQAMLVTGPPGCGKSHLQRAFRARLQRNGLPVTVLWGRGDRLNQSAPYAALQTTLRAPPPDPQLGNDQLTQPLLNFLRAQCQTQPVMLVLEDLHWVDGPSIRFIDEVLLALRDQPLFVLALGRPEVSHRFPGLWASRPLGSLALRGLTKKACQQLAQQVPHAPLAPEVIGRLIEQSAGNPRLLEELLRAAPGGDPASPSLAALALLEQRVAMLSADQRRVLRAASLFGQSFALGGVRALCADREEALSQLLSGLDAADVIERHRPSRLADDRQYCFRQDVLREAVYQMLPPGDRQLGQRLAAGYLAAGVAGPVADASR